jgi:hypothetical protein
MTVDLIISIEDVFSVFLLPKHLQVSLESKGLADASTAKLFLC